MRVPTPPAVQERAVNRLNIPEALFNDPLIKDPCLLAVFFLVLFWHSVDRSALNQQEAVQFLLLQRPQVATNLGLASDCVPP
jgi:hypothetical protein